MISTAEPAAADFDYPFAVEPRPLASQGIYGSLRRRIVDLQLKPGEILSRAKLAEEYGVSQTPVRDAFFQLQREGLVKIFPQSRTVVTKIDVVQARETQFLRLALEIEVVKALAGGQVPSPTFGARAVLQKQVIALDVGHLDRFAALDRHFHFSLCDAAGYPVVYDVIAERSGHIDRLRTLNLPDPGKATGVVAAHTQILDAIDDGDAAAAEGAMRAHLSGTLSAIAAIRERYSAYFDRAGSGKADVASP